MTSTTSGDGWAPAAHPVVAFLDIVQEELDKLVDAPLWAMNHHRRAHDDGYLMTKLPGNKVRFTRRN